MFCYFNETIAPPLVTLSVDCEVITLKVANNLKSLTSTTKQEPKLHMHILSCSRSLQIINTCKCRLRLNTCRNWGNALLFNLCHECNLHKNHIADSISFIHSAGFKPCAMNEGNDLSYDKIKTSIFFLLFANCYYLWA